MAKANTKQATQTAQHQATGLAAIAAQVQQAVQANVTAGTVARRPAVAITNGAVQVTTKQGVHNVQLQGACASMASLPATNPALRGAVGNVKNASAMLAIGNGKSPRSPHGAAMWAAVTEALPCTAAQAAQAAGSGGAAFIGYCLKNGWLVATA